MISTFFRLWTKTSFSPCCHRLDRTDHALLGLNCPFKLQSEQQESVGRQGLPLLLFPYCAYMHINVQYIWHSWTPTSCVRDLAWKLFTTWCQPCLCYFKHLYKELIFLSLFMLFLKILLEISSCRKLHNSIHYILSCQSHCCLVC